MSAGTVLGFYQDVWEICFVIGSYYQLCSIHVKKCGSLQGSKEMDVVTFVFWCDFR
jgi:hypothetical protein